MRTFPMIRPTLMIVAFALLLALPAIVNGKPFIFYDSTHYYDIGKSIVSKLVGEGAPSAVVETAADDLAETDEASATDPMQDGGMAAIAAGRSPTYSLATYVLSILFSTFGVVALQALVAGWVVYRFLETTLGPGRDGEKLGFAAVLSILTPLGFHVGYIMPDIFAGVYVVAALVLMLDRRIGRIESALLTCLLAASLTMHTTILALALVVLVLAAGARFVPAARAQVNPAAAAWILASIVAAVGFAAIYKWGAERLGGQELRGAPYLMARVIADGPGRRLLDERCGELQFEVCQFRDVDYFNHNDFLWGGFGATPNFSTVDVATQRKLQEEEGRFVRAVVFAYPLEQIQASLGNALDQLFYVSITGTLEGAEKMAREPTFAANEMMGLVPGLDACADDPEGTSGECLVRNTYREAWGTAVFWLARLGTAALLVFAIWQGVNLVMGGFGGAGVRPELQPHVVAGVVFAVVLVANAVVCGSLSAPHDRYQARVAWGAFLVLGAVLLRLRAMRPAVSAAPIPAS